MRFPVFLGWPVVNFEWKSSEEQALGKRGSGAYCSVSSSVANIQDRSLQEPPDSFAAFGVLASKTLTDADTVGLGDNSLVFGREDALLVVSVPLLGGSDQDFAQALELITQEERERAARFHFEKDQKLYIAAHALLRQLLALAGGGDPLALQFAPGEHGKPALVGRDDLPAFNLSHCDGVVSCALARSDVSRVSTASQFADIAVGVDVEFVGRRPIDLGIAHRYFRPEEEAEILAFAAAERQRAFLSFWTLKEAIIKADGQGLSLGLDAFSFSLDKENWAPRSLFFEPHLQEDASHWQVLRFFPSDQHLGAVALRSSHARQSQQDGRQRHLLLKRFPFAG